MTGRLPQLESEDRLPLLEDRLPLLLLEDRLPLLLLDDRLPLLLLPDERDPPLKELPPPGRAMASSWDHKRSSERSADPRSLLRRVMVTSPRR